MTLKKLLAALLLLVLTVSPTLAAHCSSTCGNHGMQADAAMATMQDMPDCHHADQHAPQRDSSQAHGHCDMAGCHSLSAAYFHPQATPLAVLQGTHPVQPDLPGLSADLTPPIKPPA